MSSAVSHAGAVGEPVTLTGTVVTVTRVPGYNGRSPERVLLVIDCGTAIAKTVTSAAWAYEVERGDHVTLSGTAKAHNEYRGVLQTVLSRPRRLDDLAARAEPTHDPAPGTAPGVAWEVVNPTQAGPRPFPGRPTHWPKRRRPRPPGSRPIHPTTGRADIDE